jgi:hypothetical protein
MKELECCRVIRIVRIAIHTGTVVVSVYESRPDTIIRIWIRKDWMTTIIVEMMIGMAKKKEYMKDCKL